MSANIDDLAEDRKDPLVEALRALVDREGGRRAVASRLGVHEQTLYQILSGIRLPSGRPRGIGTNLRKKIDAVYPGWMQAKSNQPALDDALEVVLNAMVACQKREELRLLMALLIEHDDPSYRQRLLQLLRPHGSSSAA